MSDIQNCHGGVEHTGDMQVNNGSAQILLTLVVPVFNEQSNLEAFHRETCKTLDRLIGIRTEIVFVNDGSTDGSLTSLLNIRKKDPRLRIIDFSRNFGKEAAMTAGLHAARGDLVILIDADLQHPPETILDMMDKWREGYDVVLARRLGRGTEPFVRRQLSYLFYRIHNLLSSPTLPEDVGDFRLMTRQVVQAVNSLGETTRFMKGLLAWVGFNAATVYFKQSARLAGRSKFSGRRLWSFAIDGLTGFSTAPLRAATFIGFGVALWSFAYVVFLLIKLFVVGVDVPGYASLMVAVGFIGGLNLMGIGVLGEYLGRTYQEAKSRPIYLVKSIYDSEESLPPGPGKPCPQE